MAEIAKIVGVKSIDTVHRDICWAREQWRTRAVEAIEVHKQRELGRIDHLEVEAWKGWERSIGKVKTIKTESGTGAQGPIDKTSETTEKKAGDPRFLDIVGKCVESRRKILGLDAPIRSVTELTGSALQELVNQRRQKIQEAVTP